MKVLRCMMLVTALGLECLTCTAQDSNVLQLSKYQHVRIKMTLAGIEDFSDFHPIPRTFSTMIRPAYPTMCPRFADLKFLLLNGIHLGMAIFDVEMTQRCIASHHCRETNPVMPSSQAGQLSINLALVGGVAGISYWTRKGGLKFWWLPPTAGAAVHSIGVATGLQHQ